MKYKLLPGTKSGYPSSANSWRPWPLRRSFLAAFITLCILLCIATELIFQGCSAVDCPGATGDIADYSPTDCSTTDCSSANCTRRGCHVFGELSDVATSHATKFIYNLLPTILTVALGLLWALPNHDIMRLEPYFQMTMPGGATAEDSLFLEYPYILSLFLPFVSWKRKHYIVLLSSSILLLMNLFVTPLIAGIFDEALLTRPVPGTAIQRSIIPGTQGNLSAAFTHKVYDYAWLDGPLPPYTTPKYALLPVVNSTAIGNETWRGVTTMFQANLTCESTKNISWDYSAENGVSVDITSQDGRYRVHICDQASILGGRLSHNIKHLFGSELEGTVDGKSCERFTTFVTPWTIMEKTVDTQYSNEPGSSPVNGSAVYMYAWASGTSASLGNNTSLYQLPHSITALFCTTSYFQQDVTATFKMPSGEVIEVEPKGNPTPFSNPRNFETYLAGHPYAFGHRYNYSKTDKIGYLPPDAPSSRSNLRRLLGEVPDAAKDFITPDNPEGINTQSHAAVYMENVYGISGMLLHKEKEETLARLSDPDILMEKYLSTLQLLFAFAVTFGMVNNTAAEEVTVMRKVLTKGFSVSVLWVRGVQCGLIIVTILTIALLVLNDQRRCELDGEPNSIAAALRVLSMSKDMSTTMGNAEFYSPPTLLNSLNRDGIRYKLRLVEGEGPRVELALNMEQSMNSTEYRGLPAPDQEDPQPWTERLWALGTRAGSLILASYATVILALLIVFIISNVQHGLPTFAPINSFGYKVVFSYIPISINMAMEPILVALGTCHCMLGPYKALARGHAPSSKSLAVDYDRTPSHFQFKQSLSTGNIALAALTAAIILSNVLAVSSAGLFIPKVVDFNSTTNVRTPKSLVIQGGFTEPAQEMYYQLSRNLSSGISAPTWTTDDYYVVPFKPEKDEDLSSYTGPSFGVGVNVNCVIVPYKDIKVHRNSQESNRSTIRPQSYVTVDDTCWQYTYGDGITKEYGFTGATESNFVRSVACPNTIFAMWLQQPDITGLPHPEKEPANNTALRESVNAVIVKCRFEEEVVELTANVDKNQLVTSTSITRQLSATDITALYKNITDRLAPSFIDSLRNSTLTEPRYDTHWLKWVDYLMTMIEPRIVQQNPNPIGIPNTTHVTRLLEGLYKHLFVINLRLYADRILTTEQNTTVETTAVVGRERAYVSKAMFGISISILLYTTIALVFLYWRHDSQIIGHLPISLAGMYVHLYASNAKEECGKVFGRNPAARAMEVEKLGFRYSYGSFANGKHFGVYREKGFRVSPRESRPFEEEDSIRESMEDSIMMEDMDEVRITEDTPLYH